jgi:SAM-dependent methyltransferase
MPFKYNLPFDLDSPERTIEHQKIIKEKYFLRKLYEEWYNVFTGVQTQLPVGKMIELGSGGGFLKEFMPSVLCTDILELPTNDLTFSALDMPFEDNELSAIFMIDTFHHIPDSTLFLSEAKRVLKKDGMIVMIEPANSLWGRFIYKNFHHEPFDPDGNWRIPDSVPLSGANGALPWIVFERDFEKLKVDFNCLKLEEIRYHTPLMYLLSGGVSFKQVFPNFFYPFFRTIDKILPAISRQLSMFVTIKIKKV